ncbi:MAG: ferredoxin, partial [Gammaproteobacteria bacterium]
MALSIIETCVNCWACAPLCPSKAIYEAKPHFMIDEKKCTECDGDYADTQCASICPIEGAILDAFGVAVNAPG